MPFCKGGTRPLGVVLELLYYYFCLDSSTWRYLFNVLGICLVWDGIMCDWPGQQEVSTANIGLAARIGAPKH